MSAEEMSDELRRLAEDLERDVGLAQTRDEHIRLAARLLSVRRILACHDTPGT